MYRAVHNVQGTERRSHTVSRGFSVCTEVSQGSADVFRSAMAAFKVHVNAASIVESGLFYLQVSIFNSFPSNQVWSWLVMCACIGDPSKTRVFRRFLLTTECC